MRGRVIASTPLRFGGVRTTTLLGRPVGAIITLFEVDALADPIAIRVDDMLLRPHASLQFGAIRRSDYILPASIFDGASHDFTPDIATDRSQILNLALAWQCAASHVTATIVGPITSRRWAGAIPGS